MLFLIKRWVNGPSRSVIVVGSAAATVAAFGGSMTITDGAGTGLFIGAAEVGNVDRQGGGGFVRRDFWQCRHAGGAEFRCGVGFFHSGRVWRRGGGGGGSE